MRRRVASTEVRSPPKDVPEAQILPVGRHGLRAADAVRGPNKVLLAAAPDAGLCDRLPATRSRGRGANPLRRRGHFALDG